MSRVLQALLALGLFIGIGFVTRHYYREWVEYTIKEATDASKKETAKWKSVQGNFGDIKFVQPVNTLPKIDLPERPRAAPRTNTIR